MKTINRKKKYHNLSVVTCCPPWPTFLPVPLFSDFFALLSHSSIVTSSTGIFLSGGCVTQTGTCSLVIVPGKTSLCNRIKREGKREHFHTGFDGGNWAFCRNLQIKRLIPFNLWGSRFVNYHHKLLLQSKCHFLIVISTQFWIKSVFFFPMNKSVWELQKRESYKTYTYSILKIGENNAYKPSY